MRLGDLDALLAEDMTDAFVDAYDHEIFQAIIEETPTIDAVPVVRCKDCIHWLNEDGMNDHVCLKIYSDGAVSAYAWQDRKPDDFCSYGERKESDGNG